MSISSLILRCILHAKLNTASNIPTYFIKLIHVDWNQPWHNLYYVALQDAILIAGSNNEKQSIPKSHKKTLVDKIGKTIDRLSSSGGSNSTNGKDSLSAKGKGAFIGSYPSPYPIEGRWIYQPQFAQYTSPNQTYCTSPTSYTYNQNPLWIPNRLNSPEIPAVDYDFSSDVNTDAYGIPLCSHVDKYGTQRGSKLGIHPRKACKKCLPAQKLRKNARNFDEKHPLLGTPISFYKDPYNNQYSKSRENKVDEWSSYWEQDEPNEEHDRNLPRTQHTFHLTPKNKNTVNCESSIRKPGPKSQLEPKSSTAISRPQQNMMSPL